MQYLGTDDTGTNSFTLQDFEPSFGSKMSAAIRESWLESYGPVATDWWNSKSGDASKRLSASEALDYAKTNGGGVKLNLAPKDGQYTANQWASIVSRQRELAAVKDVRERTPWDAGSVLRGGAMFGAGIVDPINLATAFVPWTRVIGAANGLRAAAMAESALTRAGARATLGAADAGISTLALEPFYSGMRSDLGDDYGALDSLVNIAFGTAFGGGLHAGGGAIADAWRSYRGTASPMVTPNPALDPAAPLAGAAAGLDTRIKVGDAYEPARWSVVEADALSATVDKADNQFRDRSRPAYQAEIQSRANALDPALLLGDSPVMDIGAPTLAADGRIVGGNGRTLFISKAYEIGKGGDYRAALEARLEELGIDVDAVRAMSKPVLVRQFTREVDVKRAAMLSNEGGATDMSPLEQAKVDAERLGDARLSVSADGDINNADNRAAIRKWVEAQPENKRNSIMDSDGKLSPEGLRRLNGAMLFKAYGDTPVLARLIEAVDPGSRNLALALGRTAPVVAGTRQAIAAGDLHPLDIAVDLQQAVEKYNQIRSDGMKVADYMAQLDAFGDGLTPEATMLLDFMGRNIQSPRRIMDAITGFSDRLTEAGNPKQDDMFGAAPVPDKARMLQDAINAAEQRVDSAQEVVAGLEPETREAALRASVAQALDGRNVDVEAVIGMDPGRNTHTVADAEAAADRNFEPENVALADMGASARVQARVDAAPKWDAVKDAEDALAEADVLLADTVKAGDQAFKYSRGEAPGQKKATVWQGTTARFAAEDGAPLGRFRWDMINSAAGEGAQAFGFGHYLAQQAWISQTRYRERLLDRRQTEDGYTISDGAGGVMKLSARNDEPSWSMPDGSVVNSGQKDPRLTALASAVSQIDKYNYARAKKTFESLLERSLAEVDLQGQKLVEYQTNSTGDAGTDAARIAMMERGMEFQRADAENYRLTIAALDEVTVVGDEGDRVLAPGITKYEPPLPDNLRLRAMAGDQEVALSNEALRMMRNLTGLGSELIQTIGRDLGLRTDQLTGTNAVGSIDALLSKINEQEFPEVFAELRALQERGVSDLTLERPGSLYRAEMSAEDFAGLMLWDEALSAQPEKVRAAFKAWGISAESGGWNPQSGGGFWTEINGKNYLVKPQPGLAPGSVGYFVYVDGVERGSFPTADAAKAFAVKIEGADVSGEQAYRSLIAKIEEGGEDFEDDLFIAVQDAAFRHGMDSMEAGTSDFGADEIASIMLNNAGIPGHAFLDGVSRGASDAPAYNLVLYSDDVARIMDRYARQTGEVLRATDDPEGLTEALRLSFGRSTDALLTEGRVQIVATPDDIPGGPHPGDVKAATAPDGTVYVVASNVSELEARGILVHEVGVHVGMENMLGRDVFQSVLRELDDAIGRGEEWAQAARDRVPADTPAGLVREEQLAYLVQHAPELPIVQKIIAAVRAWAYRTFDLARDNMTLTEADFRAMAVAALHDAARGESAGVLAGAYARAQTATAAFKNWFGDSKVVGPDGEPLVVYHGTNKSENGEAFTQFDTYASNYGLMGMGGYFTADPAVASTYTSKGRGDSPTVYSAYLTIKNPIDMEAKADVAAWKKQFDSIEQYHEGGDTNEAWYRAAEESLADQEIPKYEGAEIMQDGLRAMGFDGITHIGGGRVKSDGVRHRVYVAFDPEQIKSATGNRGTFDPANPDIRYSRGETPDPSTATDDLKPYDDAVKRAKQYASVLRSAADKLENDAQAAAAMRAAMPDITPQEINDLLFQLRKQVKGLRGMATTARNALGAEDRATGMQYDAMYAADTLANNLELAAVIEKRNASLNIAARLKATAYINQFRDAGLDFEGFRGLLVGTERKRAGGRISVDAEQKNFRGEWLGGMISDLEAGGLMRAFTSGEFDRDVYTALYNLARDGKGNDKLPKEAVAIAEVVNKYQTDARNTRNRFGAWIRDLQGYIVRQSHDMFKIRSAGEKAYKEAVLPLLDVQRSMRDFEGSVDDFLTRVYDDFAAGSHMKTPAGEDDLQAFGRGASLARKESASRVLYFKDGDAAYQYNTKFGQGRLAESVLGGLDHAAKSAGLLKLLGTNPKATAERLFAEYAESLRGDPKRRAEFLAHRSELDNLLATVDGSVNIPGNVTAARISSFARSWQTMSKLGGMLISSVTDLANYAAELRFGQDKNLLSGTLDGIGALTRGRSSGEKRAILNSMGVFHESTLGAVFNRFDSPELMGGKSAWAMQQFFKLSGINWWTESLRDGYALQHAAYVSSHADRGFDKLPASLRDMLGLYNIDSGKWDVLRLANTSMADGRKYITPDGLRTVPRAALENYITQVGRTVSDAAIMNLQDDLASALRTMTIDRMHHAVIEPNARTRAFMIRGTQPGTVAGEMLRFIGQFKSFPVALIQMTLGREVYGRGYDTLGDYVKRGKGDMLGLASFIALSTAMGYAAMSIKDLLRGKNPRPVDDPRTWAAAMVQGGGLGIYGDFLFGKYNRMGGSLSGSMAGPVVNLGDTAADLWTRIRTGDDFAATAFNAALANTPFANLFYTRVALDYLVLHQIQEALNPGFLRRTEARIKRENGQTFYLPPSQVAR